MFDLISCLTSVSLQAAAISRIEEEQRLLSQLLSQGVGCKAKKRKDQIVLREGFHSLSNSKEVNLPPMKKGEMKNPSRKEEELDPHRFETKKVRWYHASPYRIQPGEKLLPNLKGNNFPDFSKARVYVSTSPHIHQTIASSKKFKKAFIYEVRPCTPPQPGDYNDHHCKSAVVIRCIGRATNKTRVSDTRVNSPRKWVEKHDVPAHLYEKPKIISEAFLQGNHSLNSAEMQKNFEWAEMVYSDKD